MLAVGVVGATGYTGIELVRLLMSHPEVELQHLTSRQESGNRVADVFPSFRGALDLSYSDFDINKLKDCDVVFFATPNGICMHSAQALVDAGVKVIDLSADFRIKDRATWEKWYGQKHACPDLIQHAVYGLPEAFRESIKTANLVANPGCYPTAIQLGFLPLIKNGLITKTVIADAKSGVSGAGRGASLKTSYCETMESFSAYAADGHRHLPEIKQGFKAVSSQDFQLTFVPHLTPMTRGIHATLYATLKSPVAQLHTLFEEFYADESFVDVLPVGQHPTTKSVRGVNTCRINVVQPAESDVVIVLSVIDNLIKGAAGQAIQNMNLMCGLSETMGLLGCPEVP